MSWQTPEIPAEARISAEVRDLNFVLGDPDPGLRRGDGEEKMH